MQQVTNTYMKRWKEHRHEIGYGHLYQGRYKCFPVETEDYFYQVVRYVERNALCANLVERAESWGWSSLRRVEREDRAFPILSTWPLPSAVCSRVAYSDQERPWRSYLLPAGEGAPQGRMRDEMLALARKFPSSGRSGPTPQAGFPPLPAGEGEDVPPRLQLNGKTR